MRKTDEKIDLIYTELRDFRKQNSLDHKQIYHSIEQISREVTKNSEYRKATIRNKAKFWGIISVMIAAITFIVDNLLKIAGGR